MNISNKNYQKKLEVLLDEMKLSGFLTSNKVEMAIRKTPRHYFIPESKQKIAYENTPIQIMEKQTISQPSVVARMTEWIDPKEGQKILEIGSGSGWQSAIFSNIVGKGKIFSIERHKKLVDFAKKNLKTLGITNVEILHGDGTLGLPSEAPFDRIIITAACKKVPSDLFDQLAIEGLLLAPSVIIFSP